MHAYRFKLSSDKFVDSLHHVRSLMHSKQLLADPSMAQVTRMLLWARQLPLQLFTGPLAKAVRRLNTSGHLVIDADERLVACCVEGGRYEFGGLAAALLQPCCIWVKQVCTVCAPWLLSLSCCW
jgi:hypothetical protein